MTQELDEFRRECRKIEAKLSYKDLLARNSGKCTACDEIVPQPVYDLTGGYCMHCCEEKRYGVIPPQCDESEHLSYRRE